MPARKYAPFYQMTVSPYPAYDLRLRKGGVIVNIVGKTVISVECEDENEVPEAMKDLHKLGFNLPA